MSIDVIIPTYKPDKALFELVKRLNGQSLKPENIIIMNTEEKYWDQLVSGTRFLEQNKNLKVYHVSKREFDHGRHQEAWSKEISGGDFCDDDAGCHACQ